MKRNIIWLIISIISYLPIFGITLFVLALSGIDDSCKFLDVTGVSAISHTPCITRTGDFIFDIMVIFINLIFIVFILIKIKKIIKSSNDVGNE